MGVAPFSENLWASLRIELITKTDRMKEEGRTSRQGKTGIRIDFVPKAKRLYHKLKENATVWLKSFAQFLRRLPQALPWAG
jgi:hypothetical protein